MARVLLVDDDDVIAEIVAYYLTDTGEYEVTRAATAGEALSLSRRPFDIVLLDVKLPDVDGVRLCARLRERMTCPIVLISCIDDEATIIQALNNGGDDYITKPFDCAVLRARIAANLRRIAMDRAQQVPKYVEQPGFSLDTDRRLLMIGGESRKLTVIEQSLLLYFIAHPSQLLTLETLYQDVWQMPVGDELRTVVVHVHNLRKKLGDPADRSRYIHNIRGTGYYYEPRLMSFD